MSPPATIDRYLAVAVPCPLRRLLHYLPPPDRPLPLPGMRVQVPFGRRQLVGIVVRIDSETDQDPAKLRPASEVLDAAPLLDAALLALYLWASTYYLYPIGLCLQTSLPAALREGKPLPDLQPRHWRACKVDGAPKLRSARQQQALELLERYQGLSGTELSVLLEQPARPVLKALQEKGLVELVAAPATPSSTPPPLLKSPSLTLNPAQAQTFAALRTALGSYSCHLIEGITGSGKTEIYLQLIQQVLLEGKQALVLVPEISLTPQTLARFRDRFHCEIVAFHSGLGNKERLEGWVKARSGEAGIVIGTRSAIFTPLKQPGVIIVDEEHDDSYKQQDGFRYSGRDVAIWRARQMGVPVVLGSATPSLETLGNALAGRYQLHQLDQRAGQSSLPQLRPVDLRRQGLEEGFSQTLLSTMRHTLEHGQQVLIFLNRRGYAPMLRCQLCGWVAECPRCERSYTLHQQPAALRCHHCDAYKSVPPRCGHCGGTELSGEGLGTERSEQLLVREFPDFPVIRIDSDTTRTQGRLHELIQTVHSGIPCILVGTQMIAKGHHFPKVSLVGVLDADSGLFSADFRSQENLGQLLTQVAGRAGRSDTPGTVLIQTWYPEHPALLRLLREGYGSFARQLLDERRQGALPPFMYFILLRAEAAQRELPMELLGEVRRWLQAQGVQGIDCFGPMPSPYGKKAGRFRAQLMLQAPARGSLQRLGGALAALLDTLPLARKVRWAIDVDPLDFN
ncbi:MAG TPA: primosomal protein N' [Hyphomicrobiales bacterium]|nr:primosomal protein N' [Hyphomicrobiales bacterium]